nr:hypothetical protein [Arthrobacter sp. SX1312]
MLGGDGRGGWLLWLPDGKCGVKTLPAIGPETAFSFPGSLPYKPNREPFLSRSAYRVVHGQAPVGFIKLTQLREPSAPVLIRSAAPPALPRAELVEGVEFVLSEVPSVILPALGLDPPVKHPGLVAVILRGQHPVLSDERGHVAVVLPPQPFPGRPTEPAAVIRYGLVMDQ